VKKRIRVLISFVLFCSFVAHAQTTFKNLNSYAKNNIEYPTYDNKDLLNPDYSTFHKSQIKGFFGKTWDGLLRLVRIKNKPVGTMDDLKELLDKLSKDKEQGDFIGKFTPKAGNKFLVFGDLHGAFHSLVRDLEKLKELKIIDDDLKILDGYYFVFNGNVVDRSPYIIETLCAVLTLVEKNPGKVFYLRGDHESKEKWRAKGLKREIEVKGKTLSDDERNSLIKKVDDYFKTLHIALFLKTTDQDEFVCFSHYSLGKNNLKQSFFAGFLAKDNSEQLKTFNLTVAEKTNGFVNIEAIIKGTGEHDTKVRSEGLTVLLPDRGATAWSIFSSPTMSSQKNYSFFYDSFSIVETGKDIYNWKISSYYQDVREKKGFENKSYYLVSTQSTEKPACDGKILIGSSIDLSAGVATQGQHTLDGLFAPISKQNKQGGIKGKYIKFTVFDDAYKVKRAVNNIKTLLSKYKTDIILTPLGSPTLEGYLDLVKSKKILVLFPITGSDLFRNTQLTNIINFRASYPGEGQALANYAIKNLNLHKFAVFYQDDAFGQSLLRGAEKGFGSNKNIEYIKVPYLRTSSDFQLQVKQILKYQPDGVMLFSTMTVAMMFIREAEIKNLVKIKLFGSSDFAEAVFKGFVRNKGLHINIATIVPCIKTSDLVIVQDFKKMFSDSKVLDDFSLEGFINSTILIDVLNKIKGKITKEKVLKQIENIKNYDLKGLKLNFDAKTRSLANYLWIDTGEKIIPCNELKN